MVVDLDEDVETMVEVIKIGQPPVNLPLVIQAHFATEQWLCPTRPQSSQSEAL